MCMQHTQHAADIGSSRPACRDFPPHQAPPIKLNHSLKLNGNFAKLQKILCHFTVNLLLAAITNMNIVVRWFMLMLKKNSTLKKRLSDRSLLSFPKFHFTKSKLSIKREPDRLKQSRNLICSEAKQSSSPVSVS